MLRGLRAYQRVNTHVQGFAREQHTEIDTESAKVQTHSAKSAYFWLFHPMGLLFGEHSDSHRGLSATKRGELHYVRLRHSDDTRPEGFV